MVSRDQLTTMTGLHRRLLQLVEAIGLEVMEEVAFPPYQVDLYVPRYHVALEADGEDFHDEKRDRQRDYRLWSRYSLPVYRAREDNINSRPTLVLNGLVRFIEEHEESARERLADARLELPWL